MKNFIKIIIIFGYSIDAMSSPPQIASKISLLKPKDWKIVEKALWGKVHKKTAYGHYNEISKLWDREAIGTPEVKHLMASLEFPVHYSEVRIFDVGFCCHEKYLSSAQPRATLQLADNYELLDIDYELSRDYYYLGEEDHGMLVAHLLAGRSPLPGVSSRGKISLLSDADPFLQQNQNLIQYLQTPGVVNLSKNVITEDVDKLASVGDKTLLVTAAGNGYIKSDNVILASRVLVQDGRVKIIPVGAVGPDGVVNRLSIADRSLVVTAPGEKLFSFNGAEEKLFGQTSAAAPIVSGVLADVRSILPELTIDVAVRLLEKTAIRTATNVVSKLNGVGVVNHYKIVRVALRLAEAGYDGEVMPDDLQTYLDFDTEVVDLLTTKRNETAVESFRNLRRAFFLDPDNSEVRAQLASAYRRLGLKLQAVFYDPPVEAIARHSVKLKIDNRIEKAAEIKLALLSEGQRSTLDGVIRDEVALNSSPAKSDLREYKLKLAEDDTALDQLLENTGMRVQRDKDEILGNKVFRPMGLAAGRFMSSDKDIAKLSENNKLSEKGEEVNAEHIRRYRRKMLRITTQDILWRDGYTRYETEKQVRDVLVRENIPPNRVAIDNYVRSYLEAKVEEVIAEEPDASPYSDKEISRILESAGLVIESTEVHGLRVELDIPSARQRRGKETMIRNIAADADPDRVAPEVQEEVDIEIARAFSDYYSYDQREFFADSDVAFQLLKKYDFADREYVASRREYLGIPDYGIPLRVMPKLDELIKNFASKVINNVGVSDNHRLSIAISNALWDAGWGVPPDYILEHMERLSIDISYRSQKDRNAGN